LLPAVAIPLRSGPLGALIVGSWSLESVDVDALPLDDSPPPDERRTILPPTHLSLRAILPDAATLILFSFGNPYRIARQHEEFVEAPASCLIGPRSTPVAIEMGHRIRMIALSLDATITELAVAASPRSLIGSVVPLDVFEEIGPVL
jgi:hypothetical protein